MYKLLFVSHLYRMIYYTLALLHKNYYSYLSIIACRFLFVSHPYQVIYYTPAICFYKHILSLCVTLDHRVIYYTLTIYFYKYFLILYLILYL